MEKEEKHWFVAYTRLFHERTSCKSLISMGVEAYVPVRRELRQWSDRKVYKERVLTPQMIFVHVTEARRKEILNYSSIIRYLCESGTSVPAKISEQEMNSFILFVDKAHEEVSFDFSHVQPGDPVQITKGDLTGIEGEYLFSNGGMVRLLVRLGSLGCASIEIPKEQLAKLI